MEITADSIPQDTFMVMPAPGQAYSAATRLSQPPPRRGSGLLGNPSPGRALSLCCILLVTNTDATAATPSATEIVGHCYYKYAGDDQRSRVTIVISDHNGNGSKGEYRRLWKQYDGKDGVLDKVILFTEFPTDSRGANFMRWGYQAKSGKPADQWVYLPEMHMVRRISQRDPKNMDWGYTDEDLRIRDPDEDDHRLKQIERSDGQEYYVVESLPRHASAYGKRVTYFNKAEDWRECAPRRVDYYDKNDELLKQEFITWKRLNTAWVWDRAVMYNVRTKVTATYRMQETEVNVGLDDRLFSERQLRRGYPTP
jgi:hypothetical protein